MNLLKAPTQKLLKRNISTKSFSFKNDKWANDKMKFPKNSIVMPSKKAFPKNKEAVLAKALWRLGYNTSNLGVFFVMFKQRVLPSIHAIKYKKMITANGLDKKYRQDLVKAGLPPVLGEFFDAMAKKLGPKKFLAELQVLSEDYQHLYMTNYNFVFGELYLNKKYAGKELYSLQNIRRKALVLGPLYSRYCFLPMYNFSRFIKWEAFKGLTMVDAVSETETEEGHVSAREEKKLGLEDY